MSFLSMAATMVVMKWIGSKYDGKEQAVPLRCLLEPKSSLVEGQEVQVWFGKSKSATTWKAIYLRKASVDVAAKNEGVEAATKKRMKQQKQASSKTVKESGDSEVR